MKNRPVYLGSRQEKQFYVYVLSNDTNTVLYTGVTSNLGRRVHEHKAHSGGVFTRKYNVNKLVYYEVLADPASAIAREKQLKAGSRQRKMDLINGMNGEWRDLYED